MFHLDSIKLESLERNEDNRTNLSFLSINLVAFALLRSSNPPFHPTNQPWGEFEGDEGYIVLFWKRMRY